MTISSTAQARERTRMRVASLRPSDRNPRTISKSRFENLKRSLEQDREFLDARPLLVNSYPGRENIVIAGNMRLRAAQELGWEEVPVLVVSLPPNVEAQWDLTIAQFLWALTDVDGSWRVSDDDEFVSDAEDYADSLEWGAA